jgi:hypothetical protein
VTEAENPQSISASASALHSIRGDQTWAVRSVSKQVPFTCHCPMSALQLHAGCICVCIPLRVRMAVEAAPKIHDSKTLDRRHLSTACFTRKGLGVVRFFWNSHHLRVRHGHGLRLAPRGNPSHSLLLLQMKRIVLYMHQVSLVLGKRQLLFPCLGAWCFSAADSDSSSPLRWSVSKEKGLGFEDP